MDGALNELALHSAILSGNTETVKFILSNTSDINLKDDDGNTAVNIAAKCGNVDLINLLCDNGADMTLTNDNNDDIGLMAIYSKDVNVVEVLYDKNFVFNAIHVFVALKTDVVDIIMFFARNNIPMIQSMAHIACFHNSIFCLNEFVCNDIFANYIKATDNNGDTPAHIAVRKKNYNCTRILTHKDVDFYSENNFRQSPMSIACDNDDLLCLSTMLKHKCDKNYNTKLLMSTVHDKHFNCAWILLKYGVDNIDEMIVTSIGLRYNALLCACDNADISCLLLLLENGANPNSEYDDGSTPIMYAILKNSVECAQLLHDYGADLNVADNNGITPAYLAAENGFIDCMEFLKKNDSVIDIRADNGLTPYKIAEKNDHTLICELINKK